MSTTLPPVRLRGGMILSDEVYACIGAAILDGTLRPGEQLRDVDLAAQLGVSRTPVREALQRLERFGLVEIAVGRYTRVSDPNDRMRDETGVFTAYFMGNALRMALLSASEEQVADILEKLDAVIESVHEADPLGVFERSTVLFTTVTRATGNTIFIGFIREAALAIERNLRGWVPFIAGPISRAEGYDLLRAQVASRDADGAERTLRMLHGVV
ncbi:GntR family transcriptional regulator [Microbacterium sp.]|uniref:GntR family transcriptional regulator n=1 Tax=Microbacterium sp. TaxID=51671 RepID=UPI003C73E4A8